MSVIWLTTWDGKIEQRGLDLLRKSERRPYRRGRNEVHQGYASVRFAALPGKYPDWQVSDQPWNHDLIGDRRRSMAGHRAARQPPSPEYERNLRASEITLAEAMKAGGYKPFSPANGTWGAKDLGPPTMASKSTRAAGSLAVRGVFPSLAEPEFGIRSEGRISHFALDRKPPTLSRKTRAFPFAYLLYTVHGPIQTTPQL